MYGSRSWPRTPPAPSPSARCSGAGGAPQAGHTFVKSVRSDPHSGQSGVSVTAPPWRRLSSRRSAPARAVPAGVDVGEGPMAAARAVDADAPHQGGVPGLHALRGVGHDLGVGGIDAAVAVEVVHVA